VSDAAPAEAAPAGGSPAGSGGLIGLFARHRTAGNLLMMIMLLSGVVALAQLKRQFFPDFGIDVVAVGVVWPGATALDVEANIVAGIEPELRVIDGVKRVSSSAAEGVASIAVEFEPGSDMQQALSEVEQAVAQVTTLPEDSERPTVQRIIRYDNITRLVLSGPVEEALLKAWAKRIREDLLERGVDRVGYFGKRDEEIEVALDPGLLRQLGLTVADVAGRIRDQAQDIPAGDIRGALELQPRAMGLPRTAGEVAAIPLVTAAEGRRITIGEVASVTDTFDEGEPVALRRGQPTIELVVERALSADALEVAAIVDAYLAEVRDRLPAALTLERYDYVASLIEDRIALLVKNGISGLVLVLGILFLFLNARVAFWVAVGIPVAMSTMLFILWMLGMTINMISLFAMLLAIGIVVDDAIVVGEHAVALKEQGHSPEDASVTAALFMAAPVTSASLTTIAAFLPLLVIGDIIGTIIREVPVVVIIVLIASLIECLLVLPTHLRHALAHMKDEPSRFRRAFNDGFTRLRQGPYRRLVGVAMEWRYATLALAAALFIVAVGLMAGGRIGFVFFQGPEADRLEANLVMAPGTPRAETAAALASIEAAARQAAAEVAPEEPGLLVMLLSRVGRGFGTAPGLPSTSGDAVGGVVVELLPADVRAVTASAFAAAWRDAVPPIPGVESFTVRERLGGPPGREVDIRLRGAIPPAELKAAALEVRALLERLSGVSQIGDDLDYGKEEVLVTLTPRGEAMGFSTERLGRQLRDAFEGTVARRFARDDEEVEIRVRYAEADRSDDQLERLILEGPTGTPVMLGEVAALAEARGFALINRRDGQREVAVTAELDEAVIMLDQVQAAVDEDVAAVARRYGIVHEWVGRAEEQRNTLGDIRLGAVIGLVLIYIILAWVFASFVRPLAVMVVIPFGFVGAVLGHMVMGFDITILSLVSLLGLSGILVNDSIIMVTTIDQRRAQGEAPLEAIVNGSVDRLRAVLLTSLTTIGGLTPLLFETSIQAQFLQPMAVTLVFGLLITTFLVLFVVPALLAVQEDVARLLGGVRQRQAAAPA
jgi:multidrug efflux pump subunit AcrB